MRWTRLFDDLEAMFDAEVAAERAGQTAELTRAEHAAVGVADRLRATTDPVVLSLVDGSSVSGCVVRAGADWVLLSPGPGRGHGEMLVPLAAVDVVDGLSPHASEDDKAPRLTSVLRALQRDRTVLAVRARSCVATGRLRRVGRDQIDVVEGRERGGGPPRTRTFRTAALVVLAEADPYAG